MRKQESNIDRSKLSDEELAAYEEKAVSLAKEHGVSKVHPVVLIDPETLDRKVCYLKEPNFDTKIRVMDKVIMVGAWSAANELREACMIKEHSDALTYAESPESDRYKMGVVDYCLTMVNRLQNQFKKK